MLQLFLVLSACRVACKPLYICIIPKIQTWFICYIKHHDVDDLGGNELYISERMLAKSLKYFWAKLALFPMDPSMFYLMCEMDSGYKQ